MRQSPAEWTLRHPAKFGTVTLRGYKDGTRSYQQRGGNQGSIDARGVSLEIYIHALYGLALQRDLRKVLIIGCATGSLASMLTRAGREVTVVDIDRTAFKLAKRYFMLPPDVACHVGDGLKFMRKTRKRFDALIMDAFIGETIPEHLTGTAFAEAATQCVRRGGLILTNVCLSGRDDRLADEIGLRFESVGWPVKLLDEPGGARNAIVIAGDIKGLRSPRIVSPPAGRTARLKRAVAAMKFRRIRAESPKAPSGVPPSDR